MIANVCLLFKYEKLHIDEVFCSFISFFYDTMLVNIHYVIVHLNFHSKIAEWFKNLNKIR